MLYRFTIRRIGKMCGYGENPTECASIDKMLSWLKTRSSQIVEIQNMGCNVRFTSKISAPSVDYTYDHIVEFDDPDLAIMFKLRWHSLISEESRHVV
jgi:hypothetical protein